jgi:phosphoglucosamine mutase
MLREKVRSEKGRAIGLAHDGDADRLAMADEDGNLLDGDEVMAIIALDFLEENRLSKKTLVTTCMSNLALDALLQKHGGRVIRVDVGDRYVLDAMLREGFNFGGEASGHMIFLDYFSTGDGLLSALQVLKVMMKKKQPLKNLRKKLIKYPQLLESFNVREKKNISFLSKVRLAVARAEKLLGKNGRVVLRYSGTENKIRLLIEGEDDALFVRIQSDILNALKEDDILI